MTPSSSFRTHSQLKHWRSEITAAIDAGKLVIVFLTKPIELYYYTGETITGGTAAKPTRTNVVAEISSYRAIPNVKSVKPKTGSEIRLERGASYLSSYWTEFSEYSKYEVEIEGDFTSVTHRSRAGNRIVGADVRATSGTLLLLPPLNYDENVFLRDPEEDEEDYEAYWTDEALKFGKRLLATLVGLANELRQSTQATPPPSWTSASDFRMEVERELEMKINVCINEIAQRQAEKSALDIELQAAGKLRALLFEQGKQLEKAVLDAMELFGFDSHNYFTGDSEFDIVFSSVEGRCLGEIEGKENKAVNIEKFGQLERNLHEDFAREEVDDYAKAVLFGNAYRLLPLEDRGEFFTAKCVAAAKRIRAALVKTPDLFAPAKYLKENPSDADYARACRLAILETEGGVVEFPKPPVEATIAGAHELLDGSP